ncbi:RnfH family protein [Alishewanella sp. d11]|uniref:RnfH family protein n=1 Tax=Alishewanella sp. d11 TaxID=3414030 RepID=UPI003BF85502
MVNSSAGEAVNDKITVEVAYALPERQALLTLSVSRTASVEQVIRQSGILQQFPTIDLANQKVGIWSRPVKLGDSLKEGDRIEIYRPLIADPKDLRRRRAEKAKEEGRADKTTGGRPNELRATHDATTEDKLTD